MRQKATQEIEQNSVPSVTAESFASLVRAILADKRGSTQDALADALDFDPSHLWRLLRGKRPVALGVRTFARLVLRLGLDETRKAVTATDEEWFAHCRTALGKREFRMEDVWRGWGRGGARWTSAGVVEEPEADPFAGIPMARGGS